MNLIFIFCTVLFRGEDSSTDQTFTVDNQNDPQCVDVFAVNNQILENMEIFNVSISTEDASVLLPRLPTSIVVFDDDSKWLIAIGMGLHKVVFDL